MRGKIFFLLISIFILPFQSFSDESISTLLEKYARAGKLEYRTVQEGEGHVIVFSREDLDRMQAYTLKDVLKIIKFYHVYSDRFGNYLFNYSILSMMYTSTVRIFIDNHELSSVFARTPFYLWDNFPLDQIDHVEIYIGETAVKFGNEYASVLIKLYTKEPEKQNMTYIRLSKDRKKGYGTTIYDAREGKHGTSYMVMFNKYLDDRHRVSGLSRDSDNLYGYFLFKYNDVHVEFGLSRKKSDIFLGSAVDNRLDYGDFKGEHRYLSIDTHLLRDKSLKITFSVDRITKDTIERDNNGVVSCLPIGLLFKSSDIGIEESSYNFTLRKITKYKNNELSTLFIYKNRGYNLKKNATLIDNSPFVLKNSGNEDYYSFLVQNESKIGDGTFFVTGLRYDSYHRSEDIKDVSGFMVKAELVQKISEGLYYKIFGGSFFVPQTFFELTTNPQLKKQKNKLITINLEKEFKKNDIIFAFGKMYIDNMVIFEPTLLKFTNLEEELNFTFYSVYAKFKFSETGKILFDVFRIDPNKDIPGFISKEGAGLHVFEKFGKINSYIGIVYRAGYNFNGIDVDYGIDLTVGISYRINDNITVGIRGENLLNKSLKIPYIGGSGVEFLPSFDRKIYASIISSF